jgi:hypothetical protein
MSAAVRLRPLPLLCAALALAGCAHTSTTVLPRHELRIREDEYRVLPRSVSVPPGKLKIVVTNNGVLAHNLVIERNGKILASIPTILPGATGGPIKVTLAPGVYTLASTLAGQANLGMEATLHVRDN